MNAKSITTALIVGALVIATGRPFASAQTTTAYPYLTTVTRNDVNVRAGPGSEWYAVGRLKRGDRVTVVGNQLGWAEIKPAAGMFSLIRKADVKVDGSIGEVKGDAAVTVTAAPLGEKRFNRFQLSLPPGAKVTVHDEWGAFYRIIPPEGATVFLAPSFLAEPGAAAAAIEESDRPVAPLTPRRTTGERTAAATTRPEGPRAARTTQPAGEDAAVKKFEELKATVAAYRKLLDEQMPRPLAQRDYAGMLVKFQELKGRADAQSSEGLRQYAAAMSAWLNQQIEIQRLLVAPAPTTQDARDILAESRQIAAAPPTRPDVQLYQATGVLQKSATFNDSRSMPDLYKLVTPAGDKVVCYLRPAAAAGDWSGLIGQPVRVWGKKQYRADWNTVVVLTERIEQAGQIPGEVITKPEAVQPPKEIPPPPPPEEDAFKPRFEGPAAEAPPAPPAPESGEPEPGLTPAPSSPAPGLPASIAPPDSSAPPAVELTPSGDIPSAPAAATPPAAAPPAATTPEK